MELEADVDTTAGVDSKIEHDSETHPEKENNVTYDTYDSIYYVLYFIGRYLVVLVSCFLCLISSLYGIGCLVTLEAINFFCSSYTLEEVRQYNFENGYERGIEGDSCFRIDSQGLNYNNLFSVNNNVFTAKIDSNLIDFVQYIQAIACFSFTLIVSIAALYQLYWLLYDTKYAISSCLFHEQNNNRVFRKLLELHKYSQRSHQDGSEHSLPQEKQNPLLCCCIFVQETYIFCARKCMKFYFKHIQPVYYVDSKWRMFSIIGREWVEIAVQIYALLLYGGINIVDLESNVLSQTADIIESFAVIVALNCITGMK